MPERFWDLPTELVNRRERGELALSVEGALLCNKVVGHFDQALADQIMQRADSLLTEHRQICVFSDWLQMASYDISCRRTMTDWGAGLGKRLQAFHVIAGTRLVKMGLAVASIVVPALRVHSQMASLVAAYRDAKRAARVI